MQKEFRNRREQAAAGGPDRLAGDHGGHIFGTLFGGPGERVNINAMASKINQGAYERMGRLCQIRRQSGLRQTPFRQDGPHSLVGRAALSGPWLADQDDEAAGPPHVPDDPAQFGIMVTRDVRQKASLRGRGRGGSLDAQKVQGPSP